MEWRTRNVTLFSAGEYLALSDKSNVVSGRVGLRFAFSPSHLRCRLLAVRPEGADH